ncbi:MAG: hypothetical protein ACFCUI_07505 [Bernardetiaceae bacterium]
MNEKKILVIDTSIFCVWLQLPNFQACGSDDDRWDYRRIDDKIEKEIAAKTTLVLPLATIIETGNHISQQPGDCYGLAKKFCDILKKSIDNTHPWAAFSDQSSLWSNERVRELADSWPDLAAQKISIGDATIKDVAEFYFKINFAVEIFTGDNGLKAYEPQQSIVPRRRQKK